MATTLLTTAQPSTVQSSEVRAAMKDRVYRVDLHWNDGVAFVRGWYWENFRFNTEGVEYIADEEGWGFERDTVPSSLVRQTATRHLPTLEEWAGSFAHALEIDYCLIDGVRYPAIPRVVPTPPAETVEILVVRKGTDMDDGYTVRIDRESLKGFRDYMVGCDIYEVSELDE